jgi:hypothetical protein
MEMNVEISNLRKKSTLKRNTHYCEEKAITIDGNLCQELVRMKTKLKKIRNVGQPFKVIGDLKEILFVYNIKN